jgi:hypothetical protein
VINLNCGKIVTESFTGHWQEKNWRTINDQLDHLKFLEVDAQKIHMHEGFHHFSAKGLVLSRHTVSKLKSVKEWYGTK